MNLLSKDKTFHFIGIGGIGMSGIARIMLEMGFSVCGSDLRETDITRKLCDLGAVIYTGGHKAEHLKDVDVVVVSSAVLNNNPELEAAKLRKIPVLHRAQMLGYLMNSGYGIAIAGAHGKTTTTSIVASVLEGFDPTVVVGGESHSFGSNARLGKSEYMVVEADESDCSFLSLSPKMLVVTNIDMDVNLGAEVFSDCGYDYGKTFEKVFSAFRSFIDKVGPEGYGILCMDCPNIRSILKDLKIPCVTYGLKEICADFFASSISFFENNSRFEVSFRGKSLGTFTLRVPGEHNVVNSLAAIAVGLKLGIDIEEIRKSIAEFQGVGRRFQILGEVNGIMVVDDYAHNPTKIQNALAGIKRGWEKRRSIAVFQPHRYSRMKLLAYQLETSFTDADIVIVTDIYSAGEKPLDGINPKTLMDIIKKRDLLKKVIYLPYMEVKDWLLENSLEGDIVITLGAGDITYLSREFYKDLVKKYSFCG